MHLRDDMGASFSMAHGMELAGAPDRTGRPVIGVIGDSDLRALGHHEPARYRVQRWYGHALHPRQPHHGHDRDTGQPRERRHAHDSSHKIGPLDNPTGKALDLVPLVRALGVDDVEQVDAQDAKAIRAALKSAVENSDQLSVIIFKAPCRLVDRTRHPAPTITDCRACGTCIRIGCPALGRDADGRAVIDVNQCIGCDQCMQSCPFGCITKED